MSGERVEPDTCACPPGQENWKPVTGEPLVCATCRSPVATSPQVEQSEGEASAQEIKDAYRGGFMDAQEIARRRRESATPEPAEREPDDVLSRIREAIKASHDRDLQAWRVSDVLALAYAEILDLRSPPPQALDKGKNARALEIAERNLVRLRAEVADLRDQLKKSFDTGRVSADEPRWCVFGGCGGSWHVGGNYGSEVCRNPDHHVPKLDKAAYAAGEAHGRKEAIREAKASLSTFGWSPPREYDSDSFSAGVRYGIDASSARIDRLSEPTPTPEGGENDGA